MATLQYKHAIKSKKCLALEKCQLIEMSFTNVRPKELATTTIQFYKQFQAKNAMDYIYM